MRAGHAGLVLPPLFLTMVFCFALVLVQQYQANSRTASAKQQTYDKSHGTVSSSSLKTLTPLTPITVAPPSSATAAAAATAAKANNPPVSAPAQPSKSSGSATQPAGQNTQPGSVIDKVAEPVRGTLSNLLR